MANWKELLREELLQITKNDFNNKIQLIINDFLTTIKNSEYYSQQSDLAEEIENFIVQINIVSAKYSNASNELIDKNYIPEIAKELDLIVKHTEASVNKILDIFDEISGLILKINNNSIKEEIISKSAKILEVCNFQDNVGQRINIIVTNLNGIEETLLKVLTSVNPNSELVKAKAKDSNADANLLNGPAIDAPTQQEIDDLFNNL